MSTAGSGRKPVGRWRLHRGGVVNIWQYREQTFDFSGGRAVFQGTNGSGKSRTLELLLPLCLDGDLRHVGSKGAGTVSIRRLMLDDYDGGPNRIGYAWIELRREVEVGGQVREEFLTCGIGVKASATSQQVSDSWRFVTDARVGVDFPLVGSDRVPLGAAALRELIGADRVLDDAAFRARIAETVYGVPAGRYGDLLHLQRTLRNPDVGLKVLEGQLEQILSDALPPLDASMIEQLAASFEDLESIRENITRLSTADTALTAFLGTYSSYALGALTSVGAKARSAASAVDGVTAEVDKLAARLEAERTRHREAREHVRRLEEQDVDLERGISSLQELPAYQGLRDLQDRERLVAAAYDTARGSLDNAATHRAHADRAVETVLTVLRRLGQDTTAAQEYAEVTAQRLVAAGLDAALCPRVPQAPPGEAGVTTDRVLAKPDPEAEPLEVRRRTPPPVRPDELGAGFASAADRVDDLLAELARRCTLTLSLYEQAARLERRRREIDGARSSARQAQIDATEAAGRRNEARQRLEEAAADWLRLATDWASSWPAEAGMDATDVGNPPGPPSVEELLAGPEATRTGRERANRWAGPRLSSLRQRAATAQQQVDAIGERIAEAEAALITLRAGDQADGAAGGQADAGHLPFHRLVDFAAELDDERRAGLEAALQGCGLLTARVNRDGTWQAPDGAGPGPESSTEDVQAVPLDRRADGPTLADVLVPAVAPGSPISAEVVSGLLASVRLADDPADTSAEGLAVSTSGRWRAGVLVGSAGKPRAEFVGAGAREAARARRIAELTERVRELGGRKAAAEEDLSRCRAVVTEWESHLDAYPDDRGLISAHATALSSAAVAEEAAAKAERLRGEYQATEDRFAAEEGELVRAATSAGLPGDAEALRQANRHAEDARSSAEQLRDALRRRCAATVRDLADALHDHQAGEEDRITAEDIARRHCAEYAREAAALSQLTEAIGGQAEEVAAKLAELEARRRALRDELPAAREAVTARSNQVVKTETQLEAKRADIQSKQDSADAAERAFVEALSAPGVWAAATTETAPGQPVPADPGEAFEVLRSAMEGRRAAAEDRVIAKLQALQASLAGSHNVVPERVAGILTVTVSGEDGAAPVAVTARRVADTLAQRRGYLSEQYQGIFALHLVRELADRLAGQIAVAEDLCRRMNEVLDAARSSQGVHVQLEWRPSPSLDDSTLEALRLLRTPFADRTSAQDERLREVFTERIESERDSGSAGYAEILGHALDYRTWYGFTVRVRDTGPDGKPRLRRLRQLSSGETRLISYVTLFAAAAAFYGAISTGPGTDTPAGGPAPITQPLRLVLLDEAFERLDDPTIARMLELLVDLDMDWIITWPSGWGVSPKIPRMHIYDVLRPKSGHGIACTHTTWDGAGLARDDP